MFRQGKAVNQLEELDSQDERTRMRIAMAAAHHATWRETSDVHQQYIV